MQVWTHPHLCWDDAKTPCSSAVPVSIQSGCSTACTSTSWCPQTEWPAWSRWANFTLNCCSCDQHVCWNHVPRASMRGYAVWPFPVMGAEALHTNVLTFFPSIAASALVKDGDYWAELVVSHLCLLMCLNQIMQTRGCLVSMVHT